MILEIAIVNYYENGEYDCTLESKYKEFETDEQATKFVMENARKDIEYYFYKNEKDVENSNHYKVIIANEIIKSKE